MLLFFRFICLVLWPASLLFGCTSDSQEKNLQTLVNQKAWSFSELMKNSPSNLQQVIREGISSLDKEIELNRLQFVPLVGGFSSSKLFLFSLKNHTYVLRILDPKRLDHPENTLNKRLREVVSHRTGSELEVAAKLCYVDPEALIIIMHYVNGGILSAEDLRDDLFLKRLGSSIRKLHNTSITLPERHTQSDRVLKHYQRAKNKGIAFPSCFEQLYKEFMEQDPKSLGDQVLCHGDLHSANVIVKEGSPFFIDWAGATIDGAFTDLGYLSLLSGMSASQSALLLEGYFGRPPSQSEIEQLALSQARTCFVTATIWFDFSETLLDRQESLEKRMALLDQLLASTNLKMGREYILERTQVDPTTAPAEEVKLFALGFLKEYLVRTNDL